MTIQGAIEAAQGAWVNDQGSKLIDPIFDALAEGDPAVAQVLALVAIIDRLEDIGNKLNDMLHPSTDAET